MTRRFAPLASILLLAMPACVLETQLDPDADTDADADDDGSNDDDASVSMTGADDDTGEPAEIPVDEAGATMVAARCAAYVACECDAGLADEPQTQAECEAALLPAQAEQVALGQSTGLTYEPACAAAYVAFYSQPGCTPPDATAIEDFAAAAQCALFSGDGELGTPCTDPPWVIPGADPCMPGLACIAGQCDDPHKGEGDACNGAGQPRQDCESPLYCDGTTAPPTCQPRLAIGDSCENVGQCAPGGWCNNDEICEAGLDPGAQCLDARECTFGVCGLDDLCIQPAEVCGPIVFEEAPSCDDAIALADAFIEANEACEVAQDCVALEALCYGASTCGSIAVNAEHDADEWMQIHTALEQSCACGGDPCGAAPACVDNQCVMELG